ncbi:4-(cytidine 5'-diphospho)-2-C-methyl-D-erythritol kinase [Peptoniphilus equinus]|uniref:4-diphosphocytidyl-2-C-methyl-D-erythritol kinase n=1 Tax=Peptoniphilus equinus TaxID=3016343 RepID=A0ABY7QV00_9FIRM|nr:4-(cytidine 5'-diphospho)-2-C-methyl-D-erythritol kinase [Peptoniphilus equinus]WBW50231.1 4-(cytidine 5'-diphospho)-2-C-methyl-D-erythritol kinase [Peptoniphilus equinus]
MKSYAKINLSLHVKSPRPDGYHNIESLMQKVDLADEMAVTLSDTFTILCDRPLPEVNTLTKAYDAITAVYGQLPVAVRLNKVIPMGSGLAGGSANAADLIHAVDALYHLGMTMEEKRRIAVEVGADVPFMLESHAGICEGIGERVRPLSLGDYIGVIVNPGFEVSSKDVYEHMSLNPQPLSMERLIEVIQKRDLDAVSTALRNDMEPYVFSRYPQVKALKDTMGRFTPACLMSGSGASVYGLFVDEGAAEGAYRYFADRVCTFKVKFL